MTRSLATRILLIVTVGVLLPLALVGVWLTRTAERSGRELLQAQLTRGMTMLLSRAEQQIRIRSGDLQLLANNAAARALLQSGKLAGSDSVYLWELVAELAPVIERVEYRDRTDAVRWAGTSGTRVGMTPLWQAQRLTVALPVHGENAMRTQTDTTLGTVFVQLSLRPLLALDSVPAIAGGVVLIVRDSVGEALWSSEPNVANSDTDSRDWERTVGGLSLASLQLVLLAPVAAYTEPFERSTRTGLLVLGIVVLCSMMLTTLMIRNIASSLRMLSHAATAVAAGALERTVPVQGGDELADLASSFNRMTASLRETLDELTRQRSLAAVGEFAASLSHEVRNGLTAVHVNLQHAARQLATDHPGAAPVRRALDSVRRLDGTVTSALRLARSGQVDRTTVALDDVLRDASHSVQPTYQERDVGLQLPRPTELVLSHADHGALSQLFVNLLLNAAEAMPPGGIATVNVEPGAEHVRITVNDDGIGMSAGQAITPWRTSKSAGTGLGLSMAQRIAEAHGGTLTLAPRVEGGTLVTVTLPI